MLYVCHSICEATLLHNKHLLLYSYEANNYTVLLYTVCWLPVQNGS